MNQRRHSGQWMAWTLASSLAVIASLLPCGIAGADDDLPLLPIEIGAPERLEVFPTEVTLQGPRSQMQLVVTGHYADGIVQDLTRVATYESSNIEVATIAGSVVHPAADGSAQIAIQAGGQRVEVPVTVAAHEQPQPVSFQHETLAALSKQGCNAGACHGSPSGKGGFRLSLRAFDPKLDELTLIREEYGRRTNPLDPDSSLLLLKPLMKIPHGGGRQLTKQDVAYPLLRQWIAEGCQSESADAPRCVKIQVYPGAGRILKRPAHTQQLNVLATFSDGTVRDITPLAVYSSSDSEVAEVTDGGLVVGHDRGEVAVIVRYLDYIETAYITFVKDVEGFAWNDPPANNYVDELVHEKLEQLKFLPSETCTDDEFVRRVYLDVIGILPTVEQVQQFLADADPDKRSKLIDQLLERPEFGKFWALKYGDLLRLTSSQVGSGGVHKYYRWLERAFAGNMPYDQFARELLAASGSTLSNPPANFYRTAADTNDCVETVSQIFLGARLQCAKCHNHPFERWSQDNYYGMAAFFNRIQRKKTSRPDELVVYMAGSGEVTQPRTGQKMKPWLPLKGDVEQPHPDDRRVTFVDWLTQADNPFFAKVEVNRLWSHLLGRGIVEPFDDFRDSNPPSNAALLDALAKDFVEHGFDRKHILRTILNSRTYQASFRPNGFNEEDEKYFSHYQPRLLGAEQLLDAICHVTAVQENFKALPANTRATQLPAPDLVDSEFLKIFGQPERQTVCECERSDESNLNMAIQFFNGPLVYEKIRNEQNRFRQLIAAGKSDEEIITQLYLAGVCRTPSKEELQAALQHIQGKEDRLVALEDVCWALLNTNEFLFQH